MKALSILVAASALALSGCATTGRITTDFDQTQNFSQYQTFAWAGENKAVILGARVAPAMVEAQISRAIVDDLSAKGYRFTDNLQEADFAVSFTIGTRDGTDIRQTPDYFWAERARWSWGNVYWPGPAIAPVTRTTLHEYTEGTLSVDIYDVKKREPVWHGAGTRNLSRAELRGEKNTVTEDVRLILTGFPPN